MPCYDYLCQCGHHSDKFVWHLDDMVICPICQKPMQRLFTGSFAELKSKRTKPRSYDYDPREWDATKDNYEGCKRDFQRGKTDEKELRYWQREVQKEHPDLIL
jgi:hypothetical protein